MTVLHILEMTITGNMKIGLQFVINLLFSILKIGVTLAILKLFGNFPEFSDWFIITVIHLDISLVGYEPADLTVHPPPPELPRVGSLFLYRCLVFPKKCPQRRA